ncbi:DUF6440 family protein [Clostridium oryzae]|uniref:DUF6440 domain-containing protein n=1 Tax=Clostridium oryzae TaxID=1450648 RepID=A0A1V4IF80_9CLOT|nr:DUF6440 family protein [Clostridium oryzae]OPJ58305.1 hypothetical protein CLORY_36680 [Clostridium oryzae]
MFGKDSQKRFKIEHKENIGMSGFKIIVDQETGVNYLLSWNGYAGGITPLLDREGKPIVSSKTL